MSRVALFVDGSAASSVTITYTQYHPSVELYTVEAKQEYERETKRCSSKCHLDFHEIYLDVTNLSRMAREENTRGSNWFGVKIVNVYISAAFVTYTALNARGEHTMSHFIPIASVEKVSVHWKDPNLRKPTQQPEGVSMDSLFVSEAERLK